MDESFTPFVLIAHMSSPLAVTEPIHLEGILYDIRFRATPELKGTPLDCIAYRDDIPQCSSSIFVAEGLDGVSFDTVSAVKGLTPRDLQRIGTRPGSPTKINDMSPYRNAMRDYQILSGIREVVWQVMGDRKKVMRMLDQVVGLGAMRSRGHGRVAEWEMRDCEPGQDEVVGWYARERLLRMLPFGMGEDRFGRVPDNGMAMVPRPGTPFWSDFGSAKMMVPSLHASIMTGRESRAALAY